MSQGDDIFSWVGTLDDEVAGVTGKINRFYFPMRSFSEFDHFGDLNEMIRHRLPVVFTRLYSTLHNVLKIAVIGIFQSGSN